MLVYAMKRRWCYLIESSQQFYNTAGLMLDGNEPPSTHFCIPQVDSNCKMSFAGDPIGMCVCVCVRVCANACVHARVCACMCMCMLCVIYNILYVIVITRLLRSIIIIFFSVMMIMGESF